MPFFAETTSDKPAVSAVSATISVFDYTNNTLGRRTARKDKTPTLTRLNSFGYNQRSQMPTETSPDM